MHIFKRTTIVTVVTLLASVIALAGCTKNEEPLKIGWSIWVGWMPWAIVEEKGLLEKHGANAELSFFPNYLDTQTAFASGEPDLTHLTINDALIPMSKGVRAKAILVNDVSNGGDGLVARSPINSIADLRGQTVSLEFGSVSHFLFLKALEAGNVDPDEVQISNMPADAAGTAFAGNPSVKAVVTWNPFLKAAKDAGGNLLFDSSKIYGQIADLTLVHETVLRERRKDIEAIAAAWFDATELIRNPATHDEAIAIMAKGANTSPEAFEELLQYTELFMTPAEHLTFMESEDGAGPGVGYVAEVQEFLLEQRFIDEAIDPNIFDASIVKSMSLPKN